MLNQSSVMLMVVRINTVLHEAPLHGRSTHCDCSLPQYKYALSDCQAAVFGLMSFDSHWLTRTTHVSNLLISTAWPINGWRHIHDSSWMNVTFAYNAYKW